VGKRLILTILPLPLPVNSLELSKVDGRTKFSQKDFKNIVGRRISKLPEISLGQFGETSLGQFV